MQLQIERIMKTNLFLFACLLFLAACAPQAAGPTAAGIIMPTPLMAFIPHAGQGETAVRFSTHSQPGSLFFTDEGVQMALPEGMVSVEFVGGSVTAVSGIEQLSGVANYYMGSDPAAWQSDLPTYAAIRYHQLYPGIDLAYDGGDGLLKGTYYVAPGADPGLIGWRYGEETAVTLDEGTGDLQIPLIYGRYRFPTMLFVFSLIAIGQPLLFVLGQQVLYPDWLKRLRYFPTLLLVAIGLAPSNSRAILQAISGGEHVFVRTPKTGDRGEGKRPYRLPFDWIIVAELLLALYAFAGLLLAVAQGSWGSVFFLVTCVLGFGYVAFLSLRELVG